MTPRLLGLLLGALGVGLVLTFAAFVWPTPYRYEKQQWAPNIGCSLTEISIRTNRITVRVSYRKPWETEWRSDPPWILLRYYADPVEEPEKPATRSDIA